MEIASAENIASESGFPLGIIDACSMVSSIGGKRLMVHSQAAIMPFGHAIVLSIAVNYALRSGADSILVGLHADDAAENNDYSREFIDPIESLARRKSPGLSILTPFISMTKSEVFGLGRDLGVNFTRTWSCVQQGPVHCGYCGACRARRRALKEAGVTDTTIYKDPDLSRNTSPIER